MSGQFGGSAYNTVPWDGRGNAVPIAVPDPKRSTGTRR